MAMVAHDPEEMVRYFSDFLMEINTIIQNIKQFTYEMVGVVISNPVMFEVYQSMSSIILSTHKTYDDLKRIESVMAGVAKSRRWIEIQDPISPISVRTKSKSLQASPFYYPQSNAKRNSHHSEVDITGIINDTKTIKRGATFSKVQHQQNEGEKNRKEQTVKITRQQQQKLSQDEKTVKYMTERDTQLAIKQEKPLRNWKKVLEGRINSIIRNNRSGFSTILERNSQCLRLVRSVRKQIKNKC